MNSSNSGLIRLIAVFKLAKAALLIATGVGILKLMHMDVAGSWTDGSRGWGSILAAGMLTRRLRKPFIFLRSHQGTGVGEFCLCGFVSDGRLGLWFLKRWAEWFTVIITSSLVPVEVWEIHRHPSAVKVVVLGINLAVVGYLVWRIRKEQGGASREQGVGS